ncbi:unnamed protein product [Cunninghamella echinulata]
MSRTSSGYQPALNRELSVSSTSSVEALPMSSAGIHQREVPKRKVSLVRPERQRIDPSHRQYHYRQAAKQDNNIVAPSTTGNLPVPLYETQQQQHQQQQLQQLQPHQLEHGGTTTVRRGKSILGRKEKFLASFNEDEDEDESDQELSKTRKKSSFQWPDPWYSYCVLITCWIPKPFLRWSGIPDGPAQRAWREKIGLVSLILVVMGFVGFLTFGFTQAVCPVPPLSVHGGEVGNGYLIMNGWAYMLADWNQHPGIPGVNNGSATIIDAPFNGGGMDATFLFQQQKDISSCQQVITAKQQQVQQGQYFPCQLFNPNATAPPSASLFTNTTSCHTGSKANQLMDSFFHQGVPKKDGDGFNKIARVYYDWTDLNMENQLMAYNGDVLNLKLLQSLPMDYFTLLPGGLIETLKTNPNQFAGKDMTTTIQSYRLEGNQWEQEAQCLRQIIKVGSIDTFSIGCIASDIVLYVSLVVILAVIFIKFILAVIFGWFLSWKLGYFTEEQTSYAARMKREEEIENWTKNLNTPAPAYYQPNNPYNSQKKQNRKTLLPQTSRFTQPEHRRFESSHNLASGQITPSASWTPPLPTTPWMNNHRSSMASLPTGFGQSRPSSVHAGHSTPRLSYFDNNSGHRVYTASPQLSTTSLSLSSGESNGNQSSSGPKCPLPLSPYVNPQPPSDYMPFKFILAPTICLVTCYSEGEEGIRTTLDSIAVSDYPNSHKLLLVICDGIITGHGNSKSTPDICVDMMRDLIIPQDQVQPYPYIAIADGKKRNNMAKVYAGFYKFDDATVDPSLQQRVPMVTIVKCGTEEEVATAAKPGNRGKRDSQMVLMQFMQKVMFDERMTRMEYEFFNSIWRVSGLPADMFELCLMVDADTKLYPDALTRLVSAAVKDPSISGLCGETKIANKKDSWVSMIQVFEYYISHHQSKAFESVFGGVTCLPGCFCMYRIKAPKGPNGYWVPILANPDIVERYSENVVDTLHKKNLLLLGEDRYLSTLMLKTFPHRKMMFVPQAVCKTVVPDTFMVLLSQRRRWINSTIHNLMELLFVNDLCGTFCFSMQFVVFMDLVGTLALPAAISFTLYLIIMAILGQPSVISLILLALILGLPAVLIMMTSRKIVYVGWMILYLFSLPIWNFVLPVYAYWHFDDFSWGDTRKVEGEQKGHDGHGDKEGEFDSSVFTMKKWSEFEQERRIDYAQQHQLPVPKFIEQRPRTELYRDSVLMKYRQSTMLASHQSESEWPLTQSAVFPAGITESTNDIIHTANSPSSSSSTTSPSPQIKSLPSFVSTKSTHNAPSKMRQEIYNDNIVEAVPLSDMNSQRSKDI